MYTDAEYERLKSKIRYVLAEIYGTYHKFESYTLYYKEYGKELNKINLFNRNPSENPFVFLEILRQFLPNLEYATYTETVIGPISPSEECIKSQNYGVAVYQFIDSVAVFGRSFIDIDYIMEDPLNQLLLYATNGFNKKKFENIFLCSPIYQIKPYNPDPASIFPGRHGIVAYCTTLSSYLNMVAMIAYKKYVYDTGVLYRDALHERIYVDKKLDELYKKDPVEACKINRIYSLIADYIGKAERIMRMYNVVRVELQLD